MKKVDISKKTPFIYELNPEAPFIQFLEVDFVKVYKDKRGKLELNLYGPSGEKRKHPLNYHGTDEKFLNYVNNYIREFGDLKRLELSIIDDLNLTLTWAYADENLFLNVENPEKQFDEHIRNSRNTKILFSAPFGQGKTTFLNQLYFDNRRDDFEVFNIFPVNYSIASNEDVFRYIKADLLFQLLDNENADFTKTDPKYLETLPDFILKNIHKIIGPFLMLIPGIGKSVYSIFEKIDGLKEGYFRQHDEKKEDEKEQSLGYLQKLIQTEGTVYEDDFITQLISQQLETIGKATSRERVLIIDDLDRIDPEHTFRILNVISAHYDRTRYSQDVVLNNKFGFDKIIVVCDFDNIKNLFAHRYGAKVKFDGYINKFYSTEIFEYNNKEAIKAIGYEHVKVDDYGLIANEWIEGFMLFIAPLINNDQITLRDLLKLKNFRSCIKETKKKYGKDYHFSYGLFTPIIYMMSKLGGIDVLYEKHLNSGKIQAALDNYDYTLMCLYLIASIGKNQGDRYNYTYESYSFDFQVTHKSTWDYSTMANGFKIKANGATIAPEKLKLNYVDFHNLLLKNIERFKELKM